MTSRTAEIYRELQERKEAARRIMRFLEWWDAFVLEHEEHGSVEYPIVLVPLETIQTAVSDFLRRSPPGPSFVEELVEAQRTSPGSLDPGPPYIDVDRLKAMAIDALNAEQDRPEQNAPRMDASTEVGDRPDDSDNFPEHVEGVNPVDRAGVEGGL